MRSPLIPANDADILPVPSPLAKRESGSEELRRSWVRQDAVFLTSWIPADLAGEGTV